MAMKSFFWSLLLLFSSGVYAQELVIPREPEGLPVAFLTRLVIKDASRQLNERERHALCRLFVRSYLVSIRTYKQDYLLNSSVPIYRLFRTNFPTIARREGEGGVFLGEITRFINTLADYRAEVDRGLRSGIAKEGKCEN